jgi:hypothetical protein
MTNPLVSTACRPAEDNLLKTISSSLWPAYFFSFGGNDYPESASVQCRLRNLNYIKLCQVRLGGTTGAQLYLL